MDASANSKRVRLKRNVWLSAIATVMVVTGLGAASASAITVYTNLPFARYEVILQRMPFGVPPPPPPPQKTEPEPARTSEAMEAFLKQHRMCAMTQTAQDVSIGFIETTERQPRTYFLRVGDSLDGYRVVSADYLAESAVLEKDGETFTLSMDGSSLAGEAPASEPTQQREVAQRSGMVRGPIVRRRQQTAGQPQVSVEVRSLTEEEAADRASYVERLRQRREEMMRRRQEQAERQRAEVEQEVEQRLTGEALEQHLREYNLQLIRARGEMGPPLPMELTPEEDEKLVAEGVLPPAD